MAAQAPHDAASAVASALRSGRRLRVVGAHGALRGLCLARAASETDVGPVVYVAADERSAASIAHDAAFFLGGSIADERDPSGAIVVLPELDVSPYADVSPDPRQVAARLAALRRLVEPDGPRIVVMSVRSALRRVMPVAAFNQLSHVWRRDEELPREEAIEALVGAGYQRVDVVEDPGTFAVRGGVMDVFVPRHRFGVRIEWFGDEIERMRLFDPQSQRSLRELEACSVHPVRETIKTASGDLRARVLAAADAVNAPSSRTRQVLENLERGLDFFGADALVPVFHDQMEPVWSYLGDGAVWLCEQPDALADLAQRQYDELAHDFERAKAAHNLVCEPDAFVLEVDAFSTHLDAQPVVLTRADLYDPGAVDDRALLRVESQNSPRLAAELQTARGRKGAEILRPVVDHVRRLVPELSEEDYGSASPSPPWSVVIAAPNLTHAQRLTSLLRGYGLTLEEPRAAVDAPLLVGPSDRGGTKVRVIAGELSTGYEAAGDRFLLLSEADIFGRVTKRTSRRRRSMGVGSLTQLSVGDYVVHVVHGVGRYTGMNKLSLQGVVADFVLVEYAGQDKLYLPVYRLAEIDRYVSADAKPPKLDKMGGSTFATKTSRVKAEVLQIAEELLQIYAQREALEGFAFPERDDFYAAFEATFPFEETPDQLDAIEAVQGDLGQATPMDRLVCGDVGFGKTEVALRAAMRVALAGKQVAVLAPTTVLVQQHAITFTERMERFGIKVARLNRLVDAKTRKETLAGIREGSVDVVVGTHRLLSRDVRFKSLGLVVIDEEQRFGVTQKERFKKLKTQLDVLTLSATPIPRTLHMSLLGIREISLITTPPVDRLAIRTFLTRPSDTVIEEGVRKELARGGQVFYVVPKIMGIEEHALRIRSLIPDARVIVAHGQMPATMLEKAMLDFVAHKADVLVCTTIIESGLDIPRANTMFVARADMFGLSQLYQLRGRIGRSRQRAFCYLMVNSLERLSPEARRRLEAIVKFSELGSGFSVASADLELRGAGEILGAKQSGQIQAIGFEAYSRILSEAVAELKGAPIVRESDPELVFDLPAFLPDTYVEDTGQRLDLYRRLSSASSIDDVRDVVEEIRDRFGELPEEAVNLGAVMGCKTYGRQLRATAIELRGAKLSVRLGDDTPLSAKVASGLVSQTEGRMRLVGGDRIVVALPETTRRRPQLDAAAAALAELVTRL